jgi:hypothetical protein
MATNQEVKLEIRLLQVAWFYVGGGKKSYSELNDMKFSHSLI